MLGVVCLPRGFARLLGFRRKQVGIWTFFICVFLVLTIFQTLLLLNPQGKFFVRDQTLEVNNTLESYRINQTKSTAQDVEVKVVTGLQRNQSLETGPVQTNKSHSGVKKVLLIAYSRGGSTFLGQLFALNPQSFYWFEIVQPVYLAMSGMMTIPTMELYDIDGHRRQQTDFELNYIYDNLDKYLACRLDEMPYEMFNQDSIDLSGPEWKSFTTCMRQETKHKTQHYINQCLSKLSGDCKFNAETAYQAGCFHAKALLDGKTQYLTHNVTEQTSATQSMKTYHECLTKTPLHKAVNSCISKLQGECDKTVIRASKILRLRLSDTEKLLQQHPDLKVIHQIRDPRGALLSSQSSGLLAKSSKKKFTNEANLVCPKMLEDLTAYNYLKELYPENYLQIKYEDNAADPIKMLHTIYSFIGMEVTPSLEKQIYDLTNSKTDKGGAFETHRKNSNATAGKWRTKIKQADKLIVDKICNVVLKTANYRI